ncbi:MAG: hypothetical protein RIB60_08545 [Phycisphaerales bacterium]
MTTSNRNDERAWQGGDGAFEPGRAEILPQIIWSCVRGRLTLTLALALIMGGALAYVGYHSTVPQYTSEGKVRIAPSRAVILYQNDINQTTPYFHDFVKTEATRLRGGRVHELALQDDALRAYGIEDDPRGHMELARAIRVDFPIGEVISARAQHPNPEMAQAMLNAVLRAYLTLQSEELQKKADRIAVPLAERERALREVYDEALDRFEALVNEHGSQESVGRRLDVLDQEMVDLQTERREAAAEYDLLGRRIAQRTEDFNAWNGKRLGQDGAPIGPTPETLSLEDVRLAAMLEERSAIEKEIEFELDQGLLLSHPAIMRLQNEIELTDSLIDRRVGSLIGQWWAAYQRETEAMRAKRDRLLRATADLDAALETLDDDRARVAGIHQQIAAEYERLTRAEARLLEVVNRREQVGLELDTEGDAQRLGQAEILGWGGLPIDPSRDSRNLRAVAGFIGGAGLGGGLIVTLGLIRRRVRYTSELADTGLGVPLLGSLPVLPAGTLGSPELLGEVAHQLRTVVELRTRRGGETARVQAISSSTVDEGKSTVAVALAASYAATGQRTLLVDADTAGGSISHRFGLGDAQRGFVEAIRSPDEEIPSVASGVPELDVLPVGGSNRDRLPACSLSRAEAFFERLGREYDRVVVDTGVLAGSSEAALSCQAASAVLFVVRRGQSRAELVAALDRFAELGLGCDGLIFNRAERQDASRYTSMPAAVRARASAAAGREPGVARAYS